MVTVIAVLILLIALNAFFAASEIALVSLNDNQIKAMAESGHKKAILLHNLLSEPNRFLATIQIGITLMGFMASAFAAERFAGSMGQWLFDIGIPLSVIALSQISVIFITLILSYFTIVFGEMVPKRLAMQKTEPIAMFVVRPLVLLLKIASPFVKLLTLSTNLILRMMGIDPNDNKDEITEEEIRMMLNAGNENGSIPETERIMINNIFEFDNKVVSDIMTHRTNVVGIPLNLELEPLVQLVHLEKYSRFPVYEDDFDNIVGILYTKDLIPYINGLHNEEFNLQSIIRAPYFVPSSKHIDELFRDLQKSKVHIAVAIDEYGGTAGIVTIEDLLEEIVGNIFDEHDEEERVFEKLDDNTYLIDGIVNLRDVRELLATELPVEDYDTLSGFIIGQLGRIPDEEERPVIEFADLVFKVEEVTERRMGRVKVYKGLPS